MATDPYSKRMALSLRTLVTVELYILNAFETLFLHIQIYTYKKNLKLPSYWLMQLISKFVLTFLKIFALFAIQSKKTFKI